MSVIFNLLFIITLIQVWKYCVWNS